MPKATSAELNAQYHKQFEEWRAARDELLGDLDGIVSDEMCDAQTTGVANLTESVPITVPGLLALLAYVGKEQSAGYELFCDDEFTTFLSSMAKSAKLLG